MGLTGDQQRILNSCLQGHNVVITGQGGTGKSHLVSSIVLKLRDLGKQVSVVCSSGLACTVYKRNVALTVHSAYGLGTASFPWKKLVANAKSNSGVVSRLLTSDVLIWDEISMASRRLLELVNAIEIAINQGKDILPFGGKQVILVGDFWQLKPVPSMFDNGDYAFVSKIFQVAFPHRYELTTLMRQNPDELRFLRALSDIRTGQCSEDTNTFLKSLSRPLDESRDPTHIFFLRLNAAHYNLDVMRSMPGEFIQFNADTRGEQPRASECPAEQSLRLKPGCKVMLLWNISNSLRNGCIGIFEGLGIHGHVLVRFPVDGTVQIPRKTWSRVNSKGSVVGSTTQYPLIAAYAITCHKSQGQTLAACVVHCSHEFVSGLTYVALSRVKSAQDIQVLNFKQKYLAPVPESVTCEHWSTNVEFDDHFLCCKGQPLTDEQHLHEVTDRKDIEENSFDLDENLRLTLEDEEPYLENIFTKDDISINLADVYDVLEEEEELSRLPENLDVVALLRSLVNEEAPMSTNGHEKNLIVYEMLEGGIQEQLQGFAERVWHDLFCIMEKHTDDHPEGAITSVSRQEFTAVTRDLHAWFKSDKYKSYLLDLFSQTTAVTTPQTSIACQIALELYSRFLDALAERVRCHQAEDISNFSVWEMPSEGKGKVRYVGGWAVRKVLEKARTYVKQNFLSENQDTLRKVKVCMDTSSLIQDELCVNIEAISQTSKYPDTLELTESRQYRQRGLLNITDSVFEFFMALEQRRIQVINIRNMKEHGSEMVESAVKCLQEDKDLKVKWMQCFEDDFYLQELKESVFAEIITRIVNMGTNQFLRDFRYHFKVKKTMELRKRVLQKKQKEKEKQEMVKFQDILKDTTPNKIQSHTLLAKFSQDHQIEGLVRVYRKNELQLLCKAYKLKYNSKTNKKSLATMLAGAIQANQHVPLITALQ